MSFQIGLKLWSTNKRYIESARILYSQGYYDFIELYVVSNSFDTYKNFWKKLDIPFGIHATHIGIDEINFARQDLLQRNMIFFDEVYKFKNFLDAEYIVFHPGIGGTKQELLDQFARLNVEGLMLENMPRVSVNPKGYICHGSTPKEIKGFIEDFGFDFCLDIAHAFCAGNSFEIDPYHILEDFFNLNPSLLHVSDLIEGSVFDQHLNLGQGNIDFCKALSLVPFDCKIVLETIKNYKDSLFDFKEDVIRLKQILNL